MKILTRGTPASGGIAHGVACVQTPGSGRVLGPREVLVTQITDPTMFAMILENASAIVTDFGGVASHPAIIARELGIPCIVATENATTIVRHGAQIVVDGDKGIVYEQD